MIESRIAEGMSNWPHLATQAGLPAEGWQAELVNSRRDAEADRVVLLLRAEGQAPVVLKQGFGKGGLASVAKAIPAQRRAAELLQGKAAGVPKVLAADTDQGAFLMDHAPGQPLADLVNQDALLPALERAGAWLDAFHRAGRVEERAFQPRFMLDHLTRLANEALAGNRPLPRPEAFAAALTRLRLLAAEARDARTVSSIRHGDLNARNLLIGTDKVWGIDFGEAGEGPVGYDIARLLMHLTQLSTRTPVPELLHRPLRRAFFNGYRLTKKRDGSLPFLYLARLLSDWASLAGREEDLSLLKLIRLERLQALTQAACETA